MNDSRNDWDTSSYPEPVRKPGRAGDSRIPGNRNGPELREWQRDTWVGDAPLYENPFDEAESAPELREERSESLNDRSGDFWNGKPEDTPGTENNGTGASTDQKSGSTGKRLILRILAMTAAVAAVLSILYYLVFTVREIRVTGNSIVPTEEIVWRSGIFKGEPLMQIDRDRVIRGVEGSPLLVVQYLEKNWDGTVTIAVKEREACCWTNWCGIIYVMNRERVVLFETEDEEKRPANLARVDGMVIRSGAAVGQTVTLSDPEQERVLSELFLEMKVTGCNEDIQTVDLSSLNSVLLVDRQGFTVSMGEAENIHAKLKAMILTRDELLRLGHNGGTINVSNPENPIFTPQ